MSQPHVAGNQGDLEAPRGDDIQRVGNRQVVPRGPRLTQQRRSVDSTHPKRQQTIQGRLRIVSSQLAAQFHAPQGRSTLKMEVVRDRDLVGVDDLIR